MPQGVNLELVLSSLICLGKNSTVWNPLVDDLDVQPQNVLSIPEIC